MIASQITRAISEKPEIGAAAGGGACDRAGCGDEIGRAHV